MAAVAAKHREWADEYATIIREGFPPGNDKSAISASGRGATGEYARRANITTSAVQQRLQTIARVGLQPVIDKAAEEYSASVLAARLGKSGFDPVMPGFEVAGVSNTIGPDGEIRSTSIRQRPRRGDSYAVPPDYAIKGVSTLVGPDGAIVQQWIKASPALARVDFEASVREAFANLSDGYKPVRPPRHAADDDLLNVLPIADLHLGMRSWPAETGVAYDTDIAISQIKSATDRIIQIAPQAATCLVLDLGDYFHADDNTARTPAHGHVLDVDGRHAKTFKAGVELTGFIIDRALQKFETVRYRKMPGNHDPETSAALAIAIEQRYRNEPRVVTVDSWSHVHAEQFGRVMIVATHGDRLKMAGVPGAAASNWPAMWGETKHRYAFTGHFHREAVIERDGMIVNSLRALTERDAYTASLGYKSGRALSLFTMHREDGEIARQTIPLT